MAEITKKTDEAEFNLGQAQVTIPLSLNDLKKEYVVCDMCGYANPAPASMCKMCSNYLIKEDK